MKIIVEKNLMIKEGKNRFSILKTILLELFGTCLSVVSNVLGLMVSLAPSLLTLLVCWGICFLFYIANSIFTTDIQTVILRYLILAISISLISLILVPFIWAGEFIFSIISFTMQIIYGFILCVSSILYCLLNELLKFSRVAVFINNTFDGFITILNRASIILICLVCIYCFYAYTCDFQDAITVIMNQFGFGFVSNLKWLLMIHHVFVGLVLVISINLSTSLYLQTKRECIDI